MLPELPAEDVLTATVPLPPSRPGTPQVDTEPVQTSPGDLDDSQNLSSIEFRDLRAMVNTIFESARQKQTRNIVPQKVRKGLLFCWNKGKKVSCWVFVLGIL
jgi:hypothetical protein